MVIWPPSFLLPPHPPSLPALHRYVATGLPRRRAFPPPSSLFADWHVLGASSFYTSPPAVVPVPLVVLRTLVRQQTVNGLPPGLCRLVVVMLARPGASFLAATSRALSGLHP